MSDRLKNIITRARADVAAGRRWRAKEILSGSINQIGYPSDSEGNSTLELYSELGGVLAEMEDTLEAGRFLLLSGEHTVDSHEGIKLFVERYSKKKSSMTLYHALPRVAQLNALEQYPDKVQEIFGNLQLPKKLPGKPGTGQAAPFTWKDRVILGTFLSVLVGPYVIGVISIFCWIF